jgi:hypothetical protein
MSTGADTSSSRWSADLSALASGPAGLAGDLDDARLVARGAARGAAGLWAALGAGGGLDPLAPGGWDADPLLSVAVARTSMR